MAKHYEIIKHNAQKFADERNQSVWICKAKRKTDYCIIFSLDQLTKNYEIYEEVKPSIKGDIQMSRKFRVDASKKVCSASDKKVIVKVIMDDEVREYEKSDKGLEEFMYDFCPDIRDIAGDAYASEEIDEVAKEIFNYEIKNNQITYDELCDIAAEFLPYIDEDDDYEDDDYED